MLSIRQIWVAAFGISVVPLFHSSNEDKSALFINEAFAGLRPSVETLFAKEVKQTCGLLFSEPKPVQFTSTCPNSPLCQVAYGPLMITNNTGYLH